MFILTPKQLQVKLAAKYPLNATSWAQATDEVRDMCRFARLQLGKPESEAINFNNFSSPSAWNTGGIAGIVEFYERMSDAQKLLWLNNWSPYF